MSFARVPTSRVRSVRRYHSHGKSITCTCIYFDTKTYWGWAPSAEWYELYDATDSQGVTKTFLRASKAWDHARS
jgi:hypothetical protein